MNRRVSPLGALMQVAFLSWVSLQSTSLFGDVIELKNGTKLQGKVTKGELGNTPSDIEITFEDGVIVEIPSSQIAKIVPPREIELKYAKNIDKFADDKAGNEKLIDLCNSNDLQALTLAHRERLLEHNPDDGKARAALRYINSPKDGWILEEKYWAQLGMKKDSKNKWKFPEEIAIQEKKQQQKEAEAAAGKQLILWLNDVNSGNKRADTSLAQLRDIKDPVYLPRIQEILFGDKFNASLQVRMMLVDALGRIGTRGAIYVLCDVYLRESQNQIRDQALDAILRLQSPIATAYLISKLSNRNPQNDSIQVINRAGMALGAIGDTRAFPAMIDALITKHITIQAPGPDTNVGTDSTGNVNFAQGGNKPKVIENISQNKDVLSGLRQMAGDVNFDFDQGSWREWYATQRASTHLSLRRDP